MSATADTEELAALIAELSKPKQYAMWLVVELNLCHPTESLSESCREIRIVGSCSACAAAFGAMNQPIDARATSESRIGGISFR